MRRYIAFTLILSTLGLPALAADDYTSLKPTFQLTGDVSLTSHYVEYGISQSEKSPALQGSFFFNFGPQFRLGLWGSNTNYSKSDDHFNLRGVADVNVEISPSARLAIAYAKSQFYKGGERNADLFSLSLNFVRNYRLTYNMTTNWEGTDRRASRYAAGKIFNVWNTWKWDNEVGYNNPDIDSLGPYFDFKTGLGTKWGAVFFEGALTATSESSYFNGNADVFLILSAKTAL